MFSEITKSYTGADASLEIFAMLAWACVLWFILAWVMKPRYVYQEDEKYISYTWVKKHIILKEHDLKKIEGIGSVMEELLQNNKIKTYGDLADISVKDLQNILQKNNQAIHIQRAKTWPIQAKMAAQWRWGELEEFQDILGKK